MTIRSRWRRAVVAATLTAGILAGGVGLATSAGATPIDVGDNTSCSPGTDHCSGWLPSAHIPCMVYNVLWDHVWVNTPGGEAWWKVTVDRWWTCNNGGPANFIQTAGIFFNLDVVVPHNHLTGLNNSVGTVEWVASDWALELGSTRGVQTWSRCAVGFGTEAEYTAWGDYVHAASVPWGTFATGFQTYDAQCMSNGKLVNGHYGTGLEQSYRQITPSSPWSYDGAYIRWYHGNKYDGFGDAHPYVWVDFW